MFGAAKLLLKNGERVVSEGEILAPETWGATHVVRPDFDAAIERRVGRFFEDYRDMRLGSFKLGPGEIEDGGRGRLVVHDCRS